MFDVYLLWRDIFLELWTAMAPDLCQPVCIACLFYCLLTDLEIAEKSEHNLNKLGQRFKKYVSPRSCKITAYIVCNKGKQPQWLCVYIQSFKQNFCECHLIISGASTREDQCQWRLHWSQKRKSLSSADAKNSVTVVTTSLHCRLMFCQFVLCHNSSLQKLVTHPSYNPAQLGPTTKSLSVSTFCEATVNFVFLVKNVFVFS